MDSVTFLRAQWDRVLAFVAIAGGLLALFLGYQGVSETPYVAAQLPYFVSGGLVGIFLLSVGATAWLSADLRDDWRELRQLRELLEQGGDIATAAPLGTPTAGSLPPEAEPSIAAVELVDGEHSNSNGASPSRPLRVPSSPGGG